MDFIDYLQTSAGQINDELDSFFKIWQKEVKKISPKLLPLVKAFIKAGDGGKRLRGTLVKIGYELAQIHLRGVTSSHLGGEIIKVAAAYEIFHSSVLIHDDIIDQSLLRRGKPTLYRQLGGNHYGISQSISLADLGFFLSVKLISESNFDEDLKSKALSFFSQIVIDTALGEVLDVEKGDALTIIRLKTARYSVVGPLILGAVLAGAKLDLRDQLEEFGENLGIAFQIQDDVLGVFGSEKTLGKSVTSDIEEGKNTLLITYALEHASLKQKAILKKYYGQGNLGDQGLGAVRKVFLDTGSLVYSRQKALQYIFKAKKFIPKLTKDKKLKDLLVGMADYLVKRNK